MKTRQRAPARAHVAAASLIAAGSAPTADCLYLVAEDADPPGPLDDAAPPPAPVLLDADPPLMPGPLDEDAPPAPALLVPPVPELEDSGELDAELDEPGAEGAVAVEDDEEPPGTTIVSFSFVTVEVGPPLGTGTTAVVSVRSHAERARAPAKINK